MKTNEIIVSKKSEGKTNILIDRTNFWQSWSGIITFILLLFISYFSYERPNLFLWLFFSVVTLPIVRRNYSDISAMIFGFIIIVSSLSGIFFNEMNSIMLYTHELTKPMCMGITIVGLIYVSFISFYKNLRFLSKINIWLFYLLMLIFSYPIFIIIVTLGSVLGFLSIAILKTLMYFLFATPVILAVYLYYSRKTKVIK